MTTPEPPARRTSTRAHGRGTNLRHGFQAATRVPLTSKCGFAPISPPVPARCSATHWRILIFHPLSLLQNFPCSPSTAGSRHCPPSRWPGPGAHLLDAASKEQPAPHPVMRPHTVCLTAWRARCHGACSVLLHPCCELPAIECTPHELEHLVNEDDGNGEGHDEHPVVRRKRHDGEDLRKDRNV